MTSTIAERFQAGVADLVGKDCWGVAAGAGTYSRIALDFGARFPRDRLTPNEFLTKVVRDNEAEFWLFVWTTPWRIQSRDTVIATWQDQDNKSNDGPMLDALDSLIGATVVAAHVSPPAWDITLTFDNDLTLSVFTDGSPRHDYDDYSFATRHTVFTVSVGGWLEVERRLLDVDFHDD
jgi:hypothetical protein